VQVLTVTVVQSAGAGGGVGAALQSVFGGHAGASAAGAVGHVVIAVDSMQTMPSAQSLWALHDAGTHSLNSMGVHGGRVGHGAPSGQAMPGQAEPPTTWQAKP
jgi:hypothetical protein